MFYWSKNISFQNWNETFPPWSAAVEKQPRHSHAPSARSRPTWLSSLSHCIKCKIHCWAPTPSQEEQTEMERYDLEFCNKLELDGKTLLKQSSWIPNINLSEFTLSTCIESGEPSLITNKGKETSLSLDSQTLRRSKYRVRKIRIKVASCRFGVVEWARSLDPCTRARSEPAVLTLSTGSCLRFLADRLGAADEIQLFKHSRRQ